MIFWEKAGDPKDGFAKFETRSTRGEEENEIYDGTSIEEL